ncbi:hypothetical protein C2G38_2259732 [Gigaspora rosea]|uniref:Uncharacterized protein n=1 Tax=Gigaspora rosea TaxID=44941 RepID=A0A397UNU6_9GLOM|nr:hypothetical protein C2G38_2259732 [Gigaspora rosea]
MRNPVVVEFIKTLTRNENEDHFEGEKLFKCAVAIDNIYGIRHLKYVSSVNLALSAIKYSIAKSKTIVDIDSYIINAGGFTKFINWQETLAGNSEPFPNGLVFMAFDNEQKGQKNYLDRGYNKVIFHTVTSFVLFNFDPTNQIQNFESPWLHQNLNISQIEKLFGLSPEMQELLDRQLHDYLASIITELCIEKNKEINVINDLITNQSANTRNQKQCHECGKKEIENSKRKCPQCHAKLSTLAETQQEKEQTISDKKEKDSIKPLIFRPYQPNASKSNKSTSSISITQNLEPQDCVKIPDVLVPDPLPINPNSVDNIRKVFDHIQNISGINSGNRKWIVVVCDGLPYHYAQKFKNEYPRIILLPGPLHEEMNMLKAFVELNWDVDLRDFAQCQGYRTDSQLGYFKKCADHHKAWDSVCNIYRHAMAMELVWPYVDSVSNPSVNGFLDWSKNQKNNLYKLKYEQIFWYLQAIINFRTGVRYNHPPLKLAARRMFAPIWSARRHPIYQAIEVADEEQLMQLRPEIRQIIEYNSVVSWSGWSNQHQGLDAILEEVNKTLKTLIPPIPAQKHWEMAARNCTKFIKLRKNLFAKMGYADSESSGPRSRPDYEEESQRFRIRLRKTSFLNPNLNNSFDGLDGNNKLSVQMKLFSNEARAQRINYIKGKFGLISPEPTRSIPVTFDEAQLQSAETSLKKEEIVFTIETLVGSLNDAKRPQFRGLRSKKKEELLIILQQVRDLHNATDVDATEETT